MRRLFMIAAGLTVAAAAAGVLVLRSPTVASRFWQYLPASAQMRPEIYFTHAVEIVRANALASASVDWAPVVSRASESAAGATSTADTYSALRLVVDALGDGQSTFVPPPAAGTTNVAYGLQVLAPGGVIATVFPKSAAEAAGLRPGDVVEQVDGRPPSVSRDPRSRGHFVDIPSPTVTLRVRRPADGTTRDVSLEAGSYLPIPAITRRIGNDIAYLELPGTSQGADFASRVQEAIYGTDTPAICGWMVDLRVNGGGNFDTMLQAVSPLLGGDSPGAFVDASGRHTAWSVVRPSPPRQLHRPDPPLAVLTSRLTAHAGELISIAFQGRPDTRTFGELTWGLPFGATRYALPDGGALDLVTSRAADRTGRVYDRQLAPDQLVPTDWAKFLQSDDPVVIEAGSWIRSKCRNTPGTAGATGTMSQPAITAS